MERTVQRQCGGGDTATTNMIAKGGFSPAWLLLAASGVLNCILLIQRGGRGRKL